MALITSSASYVRLFIMVSAGDHISPITGLTPTVLISKNGGSLAAAVGTVAEVGSGFYKISLSSSDTTTFGELGYHVLGTGADPTDFVDQVILADLTNGASLGITRLDAAITTRLAAASTAANWSILAIDSSGEVDVSKIKGSVINSLISGRIDANAQVVGDKTGYSLTQTFPTNFSSLSINAAGRIDVGLFSGFAVDTGSTNRPTVNLDFVRSASINALISGRVDANAQVVGDKTGYSLTQTFPTNFSAFSINAAGRIDVGLFSGFAVDTGSTNRPTVNIDFVRSSSINALKSGRIDADGSAVATTAGTVTDKTGYSLTQTFPSNFSSLSVNAAGRIDVGLFSGFAVDTGSTNRPTVNVDFVRSSSINALKSGRIDADASAVATTAGTVSDKTGYSLTQTFPTNFSSFSIDANGRVLYANTVNLLKNTAITSLPFMMISSGDHVTGYTSATVAAQRSIDGAAFGDAANSVVEVGTGWYKLNLAATDLNGNTVAFKFTAAGCDVTNIGIITNV